MVRKPSLNASKRKTYINWIKEIRISPIKAIYNKCVSYSISNLRSFGWMYWMHSSLLYFCALHKVITLQSLLMVIYVLKLPCRYCHLFSFWLWFFKRFVRIQDAIERSSQMWNSHKIEYNAKCNKMFFRTLRITQHGFYGQSIRFILCVKWWTIHCSLLLACFVTFFFFFNETTHYESNPAQMEIDRYLFKTLQ